MTTESFRSDLFAIAWTASEWYWRKALLSDDFQLDLLLED